MWTLRWLKAHLTQIAVILGAVIVVYAVRRLWPRLFTLQAAIALLASISVWWSVWYPRHLAKKQNRQTAEEGQWGSYVGALLAITLIWAGYFVQLHEKEAAKPHLVLNRIAENQTVRHEDPRLRYLSIFTLVPSSERGVIKPSAELKFNEIPVVYSEFEVESVHGGEGSSGLQGFHVEVDSVSVLWTGGAYLAPDQTANLRIYSSDSLDLTDVILKP